MMPIEKKTFGNFGAANDRSSDSFRGARRSTDIVFDFLYERILTLDLMPGASISEAEVAAEMGVSRQPVRDAFSRLGSLGLLLIRPQKATTVCKFSEVQISVARFVRLSIELEVIRSAVENWNSTFIDKFETNLARQRLAAGKCDKVAFRQLDAEFHRLLCEAANRVEVHDVITANKMKVDRMCLLSMADERELVKLQDDHQTIFDACSKGDVSSALSAMRKHLGRLDQQIKKIVAEHGDYFED